VDRRAEFAAAPAAEGGEGAVSPRRRAILDEFDRTFHEVQSKLDQQLGGVDVAPVGEPVIPETLAPGDAALEEMERLAVDLDRAMEDLHRMMAHFQDLTGRLAAIMARFAGPPPGQGGGAA